MTDRTTVDTVRTPVPTWARQKLHRSAAFPAPMMDTGTQHPACPQRPAPFHRNLTSDPGRRGQPPSSVRTVEHPTPRAYVP